MSVTFDDLDLVAAETLRPDNTIYDGLATIAGRFGTIIVIVDDEDRVAGVVTSGDMRKALLNGHTTGTAIAEAMNRAPVTLSVSDFDREESLAKALDELKRRAGRDLMHSMVPVIDGGRRLKGLVNVQSLAGFASGLEIPAHQHTVLVVGGAGYIGSMVTRALLRNGWSVRVLDRYLYTRDSLAGLEDERLQIIEGDVKNLDDVVGTIDGVDAVVYLAELVGDPAVAKAPQTALKTNYLAVTALAHLCAYLNINRFVYTSSSSVYGATRDPEMLLTEDSPTAPVSLYGKIKLLVEETLLGMAAQPNQLFAPTILRLGTVFGASYRSRFDLVVNKFVRDAWKDGRIEVFGGDQWRPQVHVRDVARAITMVLEAPLDAVRSRTFNVGGTEQNYTINALAEFARELFPGLEVVLNNQAVDPRNYRIDCTRIREVLGFETEISVLQGMAELRDSIVAGEIADPDLAEYSNLETIEGMRAE